MTGEKASFKAYQHSMERLMNLFCTSNDAFHSPPKGTIEDWKTADAFVNLCLRTIVSLACEMAARYDGPGSGPTNPEFWLKHYLGEDIEVEELLKRYYVAPVQRTQVFQECTKCHRKVAVEPDESGYCEIKPGFVCDSCTSD